MACSSADPIWVFNQPKRRDSGLIKKLLSARDEMWEHFNDIPSAVSEIESWEHNGKLRMSQVYEKVRHRGEKIDWKPVIWNPVEAPKHCFIAWLALKDILSTRDKLYFLDIDHICRWCQLHDESHSHVLFMCDYAKRVWTVVQRWAGMKVKFRTMKQATDWVRKYVQGHTWTSTKKRLALTSIVYFLWRARNSMVFDNERIEDEKVVRFIQNHVYRSLWDRFPVV